LPTALEHKMRNSFSTVCVTLAITLTCTAQEHRAVVQSTALEHRDGLAIQTLSISTPSEQATAHSYVPERPGPLAAIVIALSAIKFPSTTVNLEPFAITLARAGAAVIVLDRTLEWPLPSDDQSRKGGAMLFAAEDWLLNNAPVDGRRFAWIGRYFYDPDDETRLRGLGRIQDGIRPRQFVPLVEPVNSENTDMLMKPDGLLGHAKWLQRELHLDPIYQIQETELSTPTQ
jgi:hypothetical protein